MFSDDALTCVEDNFLFDEAPFFLNVSSVLANGRRPLSKFFQA